MSNNTTAERKVYLREYHREWRKKNPERIAKIQERYWQRKAAEIRSQEQSAETASADGD